MILTFAICSSVIGLHADLKRDCPSEKIRSHVFMNRGIGPKHLTKFLMIFTLSTEWVTRDFGLNMRRRLRPARIRHPLPISTHVHRRLEKLRN